MRCDQCGSPEVQRSRRKGPADWIWALFGRLPYRCCRCSRRFFTRKEDGPAAHPTAKPQSGPDVRLRRDAQAGVARVLIQAENEDQLTHILLALHRAVGEVDRHAPRTGGEAKPPVDTGSRR